MRTNNPVDGESVPVLVLQKEHLLRAPIGSEHGYENVSVGSCILSVTRDDRHLVNHLNNSP